MKKIAISFVILVGVCPECIDSLRSVKQASQIKYIVFDCNEIVYLKI